MIFDLNFPFIFTKLLSAFIILLFYIKISGISSQTSTNTSDVIGNMVIGAMVGGTILNDSVSNLESIVIVVCWAGLLIFVRYLKSKNTVISVMLDGSRIQLMKRGKILSGNFSKARLSMDSFQIMMHQHGVNNIQEVEDVWLEPNGQFTIEKKGLKDYSIPLVLEGVLQKDNLFVIDKNEEWFQVELEKSGYQKLENVFYAEWSDNKIWFYPYTS